MPKDSQPDNIISRNIKSNGQTPITEEGHTHNKNEKRQSEKKKKKR